jgi:hypothetical protein
MPIIRRSAYPPPRTDGLKGLAPPPHSHLQFFPHVSKDEQKQRFLDRIDRPEKNWKFSEKDVHERRFWDDYMTAYEDVFAHTSTAWAPWYVVPADHKWFTRIAVAAVIEQTLRDLDLRFPTLSREDRKGLAHARELLLGEEDE